MCLKNGLSSSLSPSFLVPFPSFLAPPSALLALLESSRHALTPFTPRASIRQQPRTTSAIILVARWSVLAREFSFFLTPIFFSSFLYFLLSFFFLFFFLLFSTDSNRVRAACRGSRTNAYFTRTRASTSRNEKARVRAEGSARGSESAGA